VPARTTFVALAPEESGLYACRRLTIALGAGANTAIFSIVNAVLLRTLPYGDSERLVALREIVPSIAESYPALPVTARHFEEFRSLCSSFESLSAWSTGTQNLTGAGEPERLQTAKVSANFLDTLGLQPALGRGFLSGEDPEGYDQVAVVSDALRKRRFRADPAGTSQHSQAGRGTGLDLRVLFFTFALTLATALAPRVAAA
jgi:putative ABC transport system permease protein